MGTADMKFRSIWISDTHLGGKNIKNRELLDFLQKTDSDYLYLVGDIFDLWQLGRRWQWPKVNDQIINTVLEKAQSGTKVIYLPGNHDEMLRSYNNSSFNGIEICNETIHTTANGQNFLVLHGDQFDCVVQNSRFLSNIGSVAYEALLCFNRRYNKLRSYLGLEYHSISAYLKQKCKTAVNYMGDFEKIVLDAIDEKQVQGVICGHIHHASIRALGDKLYTNAGDWVESGTALVENDAGLLGIIQWLQQKPVFVPVARPALKDVMAPSIGKEVI